MIRKAKAEMICDNRPHQSKIQLHTSDWVWGFLCDNGMCRARKVDISTVIKVAVAKRSAFIGAKDRAVYGSVVTVPVQHSLDIPALPYKDRARQDDFVYL